MTSVTRSRTAVVLLAAGIGCSGAHSGAPAVVVDPALARGIVTADSLINASIGRMFPGAVFLVAKDGRVVHERAFGHAQLHDYEMRRLASPRQIGRAHV